MSFVKFNVPIIAALKKINFHVKVNRTQFYAAGK